MLQGGAAGEKLRADVVTYEGTSHTLGSSSCAIKGHLCAFENALLAFVGAIRMYCFGKPVGASAVTGESNGRRQNEIADEIGLL